MLRLRHTFPQTQNPTERKTAHSPLLPLPLQAASYLFPEGLPEALLSEASLRLPCICPDCEGNLPLPAETLSPHPDRPHHEMLRPWSFPHTSWHCSFQSPSCPRCFWILAASGN